MDARRGESTFTIAGFSNWKDGTVGLKKHEDSASHKEAMGDGDYPFELSTCWRDAVKGARSTEEREQRVPPANFYQICVFGSTGYCTPW